MHHTILARLSTCTTHLTLSNNDVVLPLVVCLLSVTKSKLALSKFTIAEMIVFIVTGGGGGGGGIIIAKSTLHHINYSMWQ